MLLTKTWEVVKINIYINKITKLIQFQNFNTRKYLHFIIDPLANICSSSTNDLRFTHCSSFQHLVEIATSTPSLLSETADVVLTALQSDWLSVWHTFWIRKEASVALPVIGFLQQECFWLLSSPNSFGLRTALAKHYHPFHQSYTHKLISLQTTWTMTRWYKQPDQYSLQWNLHQSHINATEHCWRCIQAKCSTQREVWKSAYTKQIQATNSTLRKRHWCKQPTCILNTHKTQFNSHNNCGETKHPAASPSKQFEKQPNAMTYTASTDDRNRGYILTENKQKPSYQKIF